MYVEYAYRLNVGLRGGVMILVDEGLYSAPCRTMKSTTKLWTAVEVRANGITTVVATLYLPPDNAADNYQTLFEVAQCIKTYRAPYLVTEKPQRSCRSMGTKPSVGMVMTEAADAAKVVSMSRSEAEVLGGSTWSASLGMFSKNQSLARFINPF